MAALIKLSSPATGEFWKIPVVHEDADLFAIDKPSGLLSSPDRYDRERPNLMKLLHGAIERGVPWVKERALTYLANAHRLDLETSGVLLLAKSKPILVELANQFGSEKPLKRYMALVHGRPNEPEFTIDVKIGPHPHKPWLIRVDPKHGKKARTNCRVLETFDRHSLLECIPETGRTHQIRVHLRHRRLFLVGDSVYGGRRLLLSQLKRGYRFKEDRPEIPLLGRVALHASELELLHPRTGAPVRIRAELPKDFEVALKYLRRYGLRSAP